MLNYENKDFFFFTHVEKDSNGSIKKVSIEIGENTSIGHKFTIHGDSIEGAMLGLVNTFIRLTISDSRKRKLLESIEASIKEGLLKYN